MSFTQTKILATLGPASAKADLLVELLEAGVNVFRINASHGTFEEHEGYLSMVRDVAKQKAIPVGVLYDLQGPKIRIGVFEGCPRVIKAGEVFHLAVRRAPRADELPCDYEHLDEDVKIGHALLIDDGNLEAEVVGVETGRVSCRAYNDSEIAQRKGINLPQSKVSAPPPQQKRYRGR